MILALIAGLGPPLLVLLFLSAVMSAASEPIIEASESRWPRLSAVTRSALISDTTEMPRYTSPV